MADTTRTRAELIALFADNVTGAISAQDLRDGLVTWMPAEFANPADFFKQPDPRQLTSDRSVRGWIDYSQHIESDVSFCNLLMKNGSGAWIKANFDGSVAANVNMALGLAADSYTSGVSTAQVLRKGLVKHSLASALWSDNIGKLFYLLSGTPGSMTATPQSTNFGVGYPELASDTVLNGATDIFRFEPGWAIVDR